MGEIKKPQTRVNFPAGAARKLTLCSSALEKKPGTQPRRIDRRRRFPLSVRFQKEICGLGRVLRICAAHEGNTASTQTPVRQAGDGAGAFASKAALSRLPCAQWTARACEAPRPSHKRDAARFLIIPSGRPRCGRRFRPAQGPRCSPWRGGCSSRFQTAAHRGRSGRWRALWSRSGAACRRAWAS